MSKRCVLVAGMFLFFSGMTARTDGNEDPPGHCFRLDDIGFHSCFPNSAAPQIITWSAALAGPA